ncbi:WW domain binding protein 11 [Cordyceps fumosorosea ARSEF 2679]|uniref:WW domain binding protein 11 n=1 Tax=Cordyceps fumosorosea (strain ARSEF 2679) TaxID=1081104 RepID=A0A167NLV1_CORFA|nr:WW domain binding protein 11 [Cordyceps fumosorosea ARSEF 2679]OAA55698.1 WW domain binding protein 11 [Cordyceps fumosorosea ARSEF 2679]
MPKEKNYNPVAAQRKADKAKAIKKAVFLAGKSEAQERRNERLARKNPDQVQRQIDDLKKITDGGGKLSRHEEQVLEGLEKELKAVRKAREALGDKAPTFGRGRSGGGGSDGVLGKRRRGSPGGGGGDGASSDEEDVPEEVRRIPMPRDTPPPIPKEVLDAWYAKRRAQRAAARPGADADKAAAEKVEEKQPAPTVYSAAPVTRDLQKEAVAFVPSAVRSKLAKGGGGHGGGLLEPEEADALEKQGYMATGASSSRKATVEDAEEEEEE